MSDKPKLPETPFNGVVTSVFKSTYDHKTHLNLAIRSDDDPSEQPVIVFHVFTVYSDIEPRSHLSPGDKVRVKKVAWYGDFVKATEIEFGVAQFATRKPSA
jgi:hypothetical protein